MFTPYRTSHRTADTFSSSELLRYLEEPRMRWQDCPQAFQLVQNALRFPNSESLQRRASQVIRIRLLQVTSVGNPFLSRYPSFGELPSLEGRIAIIQLPTREWLTMSLQDCCSHLLVTGATGRGKSVWLRGFILQVLQCGGNVVVFDRKGTLDLVDSRHLVRSGFELNVFSYKDIPIAPLQKPHASIDDAHWANVVVSLLSSSWNLIASTNLLLEVTHQLFREPKAKTWDKLLSRVVTWSPESRRSLEYRDVLIRNLKATLYAFGDCINASTSNAIELITRSRQTCNVIRIDDLPDIPASLYPALYLFADYESRKVDEELRRNVNIYVLDDSMSLLRRNTTGQGEGISISPLNTMAFMARVFGIGLCVSVQNASEISKFFLQNANTIVCVGAHGDDLRELSRVMNLNEDEAAYLSQLRKQDGQFAEVAAICRSVWPHCLLGVYPYID